MKFRPARVEQFFRTYVIQHFSISPDEKRLLFSTNLNGKMNVWAMDLPKGFPYLFAQTGQSAQFLKEDKRGSCVVAAFDKDGDENYQLHALPPSGGLAEQLFEARPGEKHFFHDLREDGSLYFSSSRGNSSFLTGWRYDLESHSLEQLFEGKRGAAFFKSVSPDGSLAVVSEMRANTHVPAYAVYNGEWRPLSRNPDEPHVTGDAVFTDDSTLLMITNEEAEYAFLTEVDLTDGSQQPVLSLPNESITSLKRHEESGDLIFTTEKGVADKLYRWRSGSPDPEELRAPFSIIQQVTVTGSGDIYVLGMEADIPLNIFRFQDDGWTMITKNMAPGVPSEELVQPSTVSYTSFDGREIEALLFRPKPEKDNGHMIFWPHGGPQAAERRQYRAMFQSFLHEGYAVFAPNFRGSTGYGSSFVKLVEQDWGEGPRLDCTAGIEWLFREGYCSPDRLFLVGGSYGGYMALLLHGRHSDYFRAVVDIFGVSNLFTFIKSVPDHWKPIMDRWLGDPVKDKKRLEKDSPITYLHGMKKPMLVIQGANDPRVVKEESDQIVEALKRQGTEVDYLVLDDEGHGFSKKENEIRVYRRMLDFLAEHQQ
ncbi:S9 family peptidase [Alkalicoccus luteus]|uniref:S9 family peptidase n=1 Tax=Alkalicoccus luteus TaxID=1237094 RepID=A0A969TWC6_9BACI|nr:S9 family peptidase [Alkalicoccus luteus]NJP38931.1 S9 family peptidase [Alkalicoccus luteus]